MSLLFVFAVNMTKLICTRFSLQNVSWPTAKGLTEAEVRSECVSVFKSNRTSLCSTVSEQDSAFAGNIQSCVDDIQVSTLHLA